MKTGSSNKYSIFSKAIFVALILFVFIISIDLMVISLEHLGKETIKSLIEITSNPFIGLFIGLLITSIVQSSSTTTSVIVAMVASGSMEIRDAIPVVMGANIGTTITSDLVSLSFISRKNEFRKAITTATSHDFFNILTAAILFPLQYLYNIIGILSEELTQLFTWVDPRINQNIEQASIPVELVNIPLSNLFYDLIDNPYITLVLSVFFVFASIKMLSKIIYALLIGPTRHKFEDFIFNKKLKSFSWGMLLTASIQSSSVTTSLLVPVVSIGRIKIKDAFHFILGANIGTTVTAFIAAIFKNEAAISIAIAHLLFNLIGVAIFLPFNPIRNIPIYMANKLGVITQRFRIVGFLYIIITFFLIPFALIFLSQL